MFFIKCILYHIIRSWPYSSLNVQIIYFCSVVDIIWKHPPISAVQQESGALCFSSDNSELGKFVLFIIILSIFLYTYPISGELQLVSQDR